MHWFELAFVCTLVWYYKASVWVIELGKFWFKNSKSKIDKLRQTLCFDKSMIDKQRWKLYFDKIVSILLKSIFDCSKIESTFWM